VCVVLKRNTEEFLGCCGLHGKGKPTTPELGVWLKTAAHSRGYGKEAVTALKHWTDAHIRCDYLIYPADRANTPSRRIPESLGGQVVREETAPTLAGGTLDLLVYHIPSTRP